MYMIPITILNKKAGLYFVLVLDAKASAESHGIHPALFNSF